MKRVLIGLLGVKMDAGGGEERWMRWRPTVSLFQHEEWKWDRLELLGEERSRGLAEEVLADVRQISPETEVRYQTIHYHRDPWDLEKVYEVLSRWVREYRFDQEQEEYYIHITTGTHIAQICLFLLNEAGVLPGKLIQASPPSRAGGVGGYAVIDLEMAKHDALKTRFERRVEQDSDYLKSGIATRHAGFNRLIERIERVALRSEAPILLMGPTGAGKSLLARRIYELRKQRGIVKGELVEVNCATLTGDMAASALFGHVRGAFTGAQKDRAGLMKAAEGGVLFLDEIGEMGLDEQAMLLRALEEKRFLPVGADREVCSDFQLIAGTNRDLREAVANGRFREDLLARIQVWTFGLPPLSERREDIAPNLEYELERYRQVFGHTLTMNKEARQRFLQFAESEGSPWCGNFRDLNAAVVRMGTLAPKGRIRVEEVEEEIERLRESWQRPARGGEKVRAVDLKTILDAEVEAELDPFDRVQLEYVIAVCQRSQTISDAGRALFSVSRQKRATANDADRLKKYLTKYRLDFMQLRQARSVE